MLLRGALVARRIHGVEAEQLLEQLDGLVCGHRTSQRGS